MKIERKIKYTRPDNAERVFKGIIFDVYQWQQKMFDGSTTTFEQLKRADTAAVIAVTTDKKIILLDEEQPTKPPFKSIPGGRFNENEDPLEAAKRELAEETGYSSNEWELFITTQPYSKMDWLVYVFVAKNCVKKAEQKLDAGERVSLKLLDFPQFIDEVVGADFHDMEIKIKALEAKSNPKIMSEFRTALGL